MRQLEESCDCHDDSELCDQVFSVRQEQRISLLVVSGRLLCKFLGYHMVVGVVTHDQTNRHSLLISQPCIQYKVQAWGGRINNNRTTATSARTGAA